MESYRHEKDDLLTPNRHRQSHSYEHTMEEDTALQQHTLHRELLALLLRLDFIRSVEATSTDSSNVGKCERDLCFFVSQGVCEGLVVLCWCALWVVFSA